MIINETVFLLGGACASAAFLVRRAVQPGESKMNKVCTPAERIEAPAAPYFKLFFFRTQKRANRKENSVLCARQSLWKIFHCLCKAELMEKLVPFTLSRGRTLSDDVYFSSTFQALSENFLLVLNFSFLFSEKQETTER